MYIPTKAATTQRSTKAMLWWVCTNKRVPHLNRKSPIYAHYTCAKKALNKYQICPVYYQKSPRYLTQSNPVCSHSFAPKRGDADRCRHCQQSPARTPKEPCTYTKRSTCIPLECYICLICVSYMYVTKVSYIKTKWAIYMHISQQPLYMTIKGGNAEMGSKYQIRTTKYALRTTCTPKECYTYIKWVFICIPKDSYISTKRALYSKRKNPTYVPKDPYINVTPSHVIFTGALHQRHAMRTNESRHSHEKSTSHTHERVMSRVWTSLFFGTGTLHLSQSPPTNGHGTNVSHVPLSPPRSSSFHSRPAPPSPQLRGTQICVFICICM